MKKYLQLSVITLVTLITMVILGLATGGPLFAGESDNEISDVVILGFNSVYLGPKSDVLSGNVVANDVSPGPTLHSGDELVAGNKATTHVGVALKADDVHLKNKSDVRGDVYYNNLTLAGNAGVGGDQYTPLPLPVFPDLPFFQSGTPGAGDVDVPKNQSLVLPPGDYGHVTVGKAANIRFTGGVYNVRSIDAGKQSELLFEGPAEVRVAERIKTNKNFYTGPAGGADAAPSEIVFHVAGINGESGGLDESPQAVEIGLDSEIFANFYVPDGTFKFKNGTIAEGAFIARDVDVGNGCQISLDSGFTIPVNRAPTPADDAFSVLQGETFYSAAVGFNLLTNDTDPNSGDLLSVTETPVVRPVYGAITLNADGSFIYTHHGVETAPDNIVYEVCDNGEPVLCTTANIVASVTEAPVNQPPAADPQDVVTSGDVNLQITLGASDPENEFLVYSLLTLPTNGALFDGASEVVAIPYDLNGATVTYDPASGDDLTDGFTFAASDPGGETGAASVRINPDGNTQPPDSPPPPDPPGAYTVTAEDGAAETLVETPVVITLTGEGPCEVAAQPGDCEIEIDGVCHVYYDPGECLQDMTLTFAVEGDCVDTACTSPTLGSLSNLTQDPATAPRSANVTYTPNAGSAGEDSFQFEACGEIDGVQVCERASVSVTIDQPAPAPLVTARDQILETPEDTSLPITLTSGVVDANTGEPIGPSYTQSSSIPASIAGNVADSDANGLGDNKTNLTNYNLGRTMGPAILSTGGAGWEGAARTHMEWDLSMIPNPYVQNAVVTLSADPAGDEVLDTSFYLVQPDGNGSLDLTDYEATATPIPGVVLPASVGAGEFSFDVTSQLQTVVDGGYAYFSLQGRVDESSTCTAGPCRGLQVRSSSPFNASFPCDGLTYGPCFPTLDVNSSAFQVTFSIASLPASGALKDSGGNAITCAPAPNSRDSNLCETPAALPTSAVTYTPNAGFNGSDAFQFQVDDGVSTDVGAIIVTVGDPPAAPDPCIDNGRDGGCEP